MALFKIEKGLASALEANRPNTTEGYCYVTTDDGKFYIDTATATGTENRIVLNAGTADHTKGTLTIESNNGTVLGTFNGEDATIRITEGGLTEPIVLTKDVSYGDELPPYGEEGQLFFLAGDDISLPTGGTIGQVLTKQSAEDGDAAWMDVQGLPEGGTVGQVLVKNSSTQGDAQWASLATASTTANGLMASVDKAKLDYSNIAYGTCSTAAATSTKVITISSNSNWKLTTGSIITVKFTNTNTASNPKFNVNGTGEKDVWYNTALITTSNLAMAGTANRPMTFMYDGTQYVFIGWSYDANTTYYTSNVHCTTAAATAAKVGTTSYYTLNNNRYFMCMMRYANTAASALTLNINSAGAKPIYINGSASSSTNYTLPAGIYLVYYDGAAYQFRTDTLQPGTSLRSYYANVANTTSDTKYYLTGVAGTTEGYYRLFRAYNTSGSANTTGCYFNGSTGVLYGAAWNDYAEYRELKEKIEIPYGRIVVENGDDTLSLSTKRLQGGGNVCSDTFGFAIGETEKAQMPIAVSGRALVYPYEDRNSYEPGDAVCTGPEGTVSKMTREEIKEYPDRIIGYVSAVPTYETWGENNVSVNGRIWIKVV